MLKLLLLIAPPKGKKVALPLSPIITSFPRPVVILSAPAPPRTIVRPSVDLMISAPPMLGSIDLISVNPPEALNVARPLSPKRVLYPEPAVIVSLPKPPNATFWPLPMVILSLPPMPVSVERTLTSTR